MNVRKAAGTTFWLIFFFAGLSYLLPAIGNSLPNAIAEAARLLYAKMHPQGYIGDYFTFVAYIAILIMIVVGVLDAIMNNRRHFQLLASFNVLIVLSLPVIVTAVIPPVTLNIFWGILQLVAILGTYWTFRKFIRNNRKEGQKLIPFVKEIKIGGGTPTGHISDHYIVFGASLVLLAFGALQIGTLLIFVVAH
jgi:membrane protein insertase Oxa1/YidC/SpoIIIJ